MADVSKLQMLIETYGIAVRAGVITPCLEDEEEFRKMLALKPASQNVKDAWAETKGVRSPITLSAKVQDVSPDDATTEDDTDGNATEEPIPPTKQKQVTK